jgi:hypothetical protein
MKHSQFIITVTQALVCLIAMLGCAPTNMGNSSAWELIQISGKKLELIDLTKLETYQFQKNGLVAAIVGKKDGETTAPVLYWKITNNNLLISDSPDFKDFESFSTPHLNGDVITVKRGVRWSQFKLVQ